MIFSITGRIDERTKIDVMTGDQSSMVLNFYFTGYGPLSPDFQSVNLHIMRENYADVAKKLRDAAANLEKGLKLGEVVR